MLAIYQLDALRISNARELAEHLRRLYPNDKEVRLATDGLGSSLLSERLSESELKQTQQLVTQPSEASFRLGLLFADQQRWPEAQSAFLTPSRQFQIIQAIALILRLVMIISVSIDWPLSIISNS